MNGKEQRIATSFWTLQGGQGDPLIVGPSWPISPQETTPEAASEETFDNVKGIAQPGCQHHFFWFFHSAADRRKRQMILTCFNCIQLPGCGHQTRSPLSSCRLPAAVISVQSEGFEQRESAAFTWPLLSFVHIYPLFQAGMGSFQTRWSAGPCGTMTFPARQCLHASSAHAHATVASDSWMSLDVV